MNQHFDPPLEEAPPGVLVPSLGTVKVKVSSLKYIRNITQLADSREAVTAYVESNYPLTVVEVKRDSLGRHFLVTVVQREQRVSAE